MATRIHVTAARNVTPDQVKSCFTEILGPAFAEVPVYEQAGWVWFQTSVWGVGGDALCKGLARLGTPGLQFTTSDGDRWHLSVFAPGRDPVQILHEFGHHSYEPDPARDAEYTAPEPQEADQVPPELAFLEDDPPPPEKQRPWSPFDQVAEDYASMGMPLPDSLRDEVQGMPYSQAVKRFSAWYVTQVLHTLTNAGIPHDAAAVRRVLLWDNVTENERGGDLGNLPRLLAVLGLGHHWNEYVQNSENPPPPEACAYEPEPPPPVDFLATIQNSTQHLPLTPVSGGPVALPLRKLSDLAFLAEACAAEESPVVRLRLEVPGRFDSAAYPLPEEVGQRVEVEYLANGVQMGLENAMLLPWRHLKEGLGKPLAKLLRYPPAGAILECSFGHAQEPGACQRYRGQVRDEVWQIDQTYPPLTHDVLHDALELATIAEKKKKYTARDEAEAEAVMAMVPMDSYLHNMDVRRKELVISCQYDVGQLAKLFFRQRYQDHWQVQHVAEKAAKDYRERLQQEKDMRRNMAQAARNRAAPHDEEVLYEGKKSRFWRADFTQLTELDQTQREQFDTAMEQRGYRHLGDMVAKKYRDIILRCFGSADGLVYALIMGKRAFYMGYECISAFADGSRLTTTTNGSVDSHPEIKVYYKLCAGLEPGALEEKHRWGIARFRTHKGLRPMPLEMSLLGVARAMDEAIAREEARQEQEKLTQDDAEA